MSEYFESRPDKRGGEPCVKGTRIPVRIIAGLVRDGYPPRDVKQLYPGVTAAMARASIDFMDQQRGR